jgi:Fe2+ or Zn2+ uptake regulation protein
LNNSNYENQAIKALKTAGFRITMPRVQVIRTLAASEVAIDPYEIHGRIIQEGGRIDVVSVYRILETLKECGAIFRVGALKGNKYFRRESPAPGGHSIIAVDPDSGKVQELHPGQDMPKGAKSSQTEVVAAL